MSTNDLTVAQYMTAMPASADEGLLLADAEERMGLDNIRHLIVLSGSHVTGVLSNRDISVALASPGADRKKMIVRDAMSEQPYVCTPTTPLHEVAHAMEAHRWGCAIVVDGDEVVGIFTTTDALRALRAMLTGKPAEPAVKPRHLPPTEPELPRRFHLHKHRPIGGPESAVFTTLR
jgi:acetoin utilization protein AcuB